MGYTQRERESRTSLRMYKTRALALIGRLQRTCTSICVARSDSHEGGVAGSSIVRRPAPKGEQTYA